MPLGLWPEGDCTIVERANLTRRRLLASGGSVLVASVGLPARTAASRPFRLGLTPVFLDNDAVVIDALRNALQGALGGPVAMHQRRTYKEVTQMLIEGTLDAAWLCGYPYLQHVDVLDLVAVPVWQHRPLYQSYLIVSSGDQASSLADLKQDVHAFSDPDSNSGFLVTASDLARMGVRPEDFFRRTFFTYGHRNVVRAVSAGLARSGSVDGYVWEVLARREPDLTKNTKVIAKSEWLGFPPVCARRDRMADPEVMAFRQAVLDFDTTPEGRTALALLQLDGMAVADRTLFDGIAQRMRVYAGMQ